MVEKKRGDWGRRDRRAGREVGLKEKKQCCWKRKSYVTAGERRSSMAGKEEAG